MHFPFPIRERAAGSIREARLSDTVPEHRSSGIRVRLMRQILRFPKLAFAILAVCATAVLFSLATRHTPKQSHIEWQADRVLVDKSAHTLTLLRQGRVLALYPVALGRGGIGQKLRAGDNRVPEGQYRIVGRNGHSAFHRALRVGYPTLEQASEARVRGVDPGGDIMVHGIRNGLGWIGPLQSHVDWTKGCIAVTDEQIDEIWRAVPDGTVIEIRP